MPEEMTAPEDQDQPVTEAPPEEGTSAPPEETEAPEFFEENFDPSALPDELQPAYKQMHGAFTKKTQDLAEQRKSFESLGLSDEWIKDYNDPESRDHAVRWFLEQQGYEIPDDDDEDYPDDEAEGEEVEQFHDPRVDELLRREEEKEMIALDREIGEHISELAKNAGITLTARQAQAMKREAFDAGANPEGTEQVFRDWAEDLKSYKDEVIQSYRSSKRDAPDPPQTGGSPGTTPVPPSDAKGRLELANAVAQRALDGA